MLRVALQTSNESAAAADVGSSTTNQLHSCHDVSISISTIHSTLFISSTFSLFDIFLSFYIRFYTVSQKKTSPFLFF